MSAVGEHFFNEFLKGMKNSANDIIRNAVERQSDATRAWIEQSLEINGTDQTSEYLQDMIEVNQHYTGVRPEINSLVSLVLELSENDIQRGTADFTFQSEGAGENGTMDTFYHDGKGGTVTAPNPDRNEENIKDSGVTSPEVHPLYEPWMKAVENAKDAKSRGDTYGQEAAERVLDTLRERIGDDPSHSTAPAVPDKPAPVDHSDDPDYEPGYVPDDADYTDREQEADARLEDEMESRYNPDENIDQFGHEVMD